MNAGNPNKVVSKESQKLLIATFNSNSTVETYKTGQEGIPFCDSELSVRSSRQLIYILKTLDSMLSNLHTY